MICLRTIPSTQCSYHSLQPMLFSTYTLHLTDDSLYLAVYHLQPMAYPRVCSLQSTPYILQPYALQLRLKSLKLRVYDKNLALYTLYLTDYNIQPIAYTFHRTAVSLQSTS